MEQSRQQNNPQKSPTSEGGLRALLRRINQQIRKMRLVLFAENIWVRLLPALCVVAIFMSLSWFGYFRSVPDWLRLVSLAVFGLALVGSMVLLRGLRWPGRFSALDRLEKDNSIEHQALAAQSDSVATEDPYARALWHAHQKRMAARIDAIRVRAPRPDTPRVDPYGLRALVLLLLVVAFAFSYSGQSGRLSDAFKSHTPAQLVAGTRIDAWVTPPDYTKKAPIFLTGNTAGLPDTITIPEGSEMLVRIVGGNGSEEVVFGSGDDTLAIEESEDVEDTRSSQGGGITARNFRFEAPSDGVLAIRQGARTVESWNFALIEDEPPVIAFDGNPGRAVNGALEIAFMVKDDYGVQSAYAEIVPSEPPAEGANPLYDAPEFPLTLPRSSARENKGLESRSLAEHPLAGLPVKITLVAQDYQGQVGRSETHEMILPGRFFNNLLAGSVAEQRQIMALDTNQLGRMFELNDAITMAPEETIDNTTHYLLLQSARARVEQAWDEEMLRDAADYMWNIALGIEDGDLSFAERRLRDAQRALSEALERDASDEEIQALMDELREAMQDYMEALAQQMQQNQNNAMQQIPPEALQNILRQQDLERMLDQIENLAKSGARDQAQQLLSELQRMMNNLQTGQHMQQQGDNPMRQQMDKLGELMQQQQQLMDETFNLEQALRDRQRQEFFNNDGQQQQQGPPQQGENQQMTEEELREALRQLREQQQQLQEQLGELQEQLEQFGMGPNEGFDQAGEAMGEAGEALGEADGDTAVGEQGRALEALRQGARQMMNQMQQAMGQNPGTQPGNARREPLGTDPLGRSSANTGSEFGQDVKVPEEADIQRARRILEAIRERLGDAFRPEIERHYLERLLDNNR